VGYYGGNFMEGFLRREEETAYIKTAKVIFIITMKICCIKKRKRKAELNYSKIHTSL
jgi:hypothetical protein